MTTKSENEKPEWRPIEPDEETEVWLEYTLDYNKCIGEICSFPESYSTE